MATAVVAVTGSERLGVHSQIVWGNYCVLYYDLCDWWDHHL